MKIFRMAETAARAADANSFVGPAMTRLLASSDEGASVHVYRVEFGDGARTNWHRHSGAQWLFVIDGRIRIQREGEPVADASDGDAIVIPRVRSTGTAPRPARAASTSRSTSTRRRSGSKR